MLNIYISFGRLSVKVCEKGQFFTARFSNCNVTTALQSTYVFLFRDAIENKTDKNKNLPENIFPGVIWSLN